MILSAVKNWWVDSLVYHVEPKQKINEKWTENKPMSMISPAQSDYWGRQSWDKVLLHW